jgi:hypothetical protein
VFETTTLDRQEDIRIRNSCLGESVLHLKKSSLYLQLFELAIAM